MTFNNNLHFISVPELSYVSVYRFLFIHNHFVCCFLSNCASNVSTFEKHYQAFCAFTALQENVDKNAVDSFRFHEHKKKKKKIRLDLEVVSLSWGERSKRALRDNEI